MMMINSTPPSLPSEFAVQLPEMVWFILMPIISWFTSLGVFCKSSDLEKLRASIAERYMPRDEYAQDLRLIREELQHLSRHVNRLIPKVMDLLDKQD
jgi:hypothetical protein